MVKMQNSSGKTKTLGFLAGVLALVFVATSCHKDAPVTPNTVDAGDEKAAAEKIATADQLYAAREDLQKARVAVATLRQAVTADYGNFEAEWKLSRAAFFVGDHTDNDDEAKDMFKLGIDAGKAAVKLKADKVEGHFWLGANYGGDAQKSTLASLATVEDIKTEMETVLKIDEKFQGGAAYLGLGQLYLQAPKVLGGDTDKAVENLKKGLAISPTNSLMKYYLAQAYESQNKDADAKKLLDEVLTMQPDAQYVAEHKDAVAKANKLKQKIGG
jgi:tetratricopeptide (TPR) repeat protein